MTYEHIRRYAQRFIPPDEDDASGRRAAFRLGCSFILRDQTDRGIHAMAARCYPQNRGRRVAFIDGAVWARRQEAA